MKFQNRHTRRVDALHAARLQKGGSGYSVDTLATLERESRVTQNKSRPKHAKLCVKPKRLRTLYRKHFNMWTATDSERKH